MTLIKQLLLDLPFCHMAKQETIDDLLNHAEQIEMEPDSFVTQQYHAANDFYFLVSGSIQFFIHLDESHGNLAVGGTEQAWSAIGWSGFREPHRYATTVRCVKSCTLVKWPIQVLNELFRNDPIFGYDFCCFVLETSVELLGQTRNMLGKYNRIFEHIPCNALQENPTDYEANPDELMHLLQRSAFFSEHEESFLQQLLAIAKKRHYSKGEPLFIESDEAEGIYILASGRVSLGFASKKAGNYSDYYQTAPHTEFRSLTEPGRIIGWTSMLPDRLNDVSAVATENTVVYFLDQDALDDLIKQDPRAGLRLIQRMLWLVGNHLRSTRAQLISQRFNQELLAIRNLLQQSSAQLPIISELYQIPHLLESRITQYHAIKILDQLANSSHQLESQIASLSLDILAEVRREAEFYQGLLTSYESVVHAPKRIQAPEIRRRCDENFTRAFKKIRYKIKGKENLPKSGGHIFVLNHLICHPYHQLPNQFELTLDAQFVSSMVLFEHYKDSPIRVVRKSRSEEYGHQDYYDRLGHLYVSTNESDPLDENREQAKIRRKEFYQTAGEILKSGKNLVICPRAPVIGPRIHPAR